MTSAERGGRGGGGMKRSIEQICKRKRGEKERGREEWGSIIDRRRRIVTDLVISAY